MFLRRGTRAVELRPDGLFAAPAVIEALSAAVLRCLDEYVREHPALGAIERPELRTRLAAALGGRRAAFCDDVLALLKQQGVVLLETNSVARAGRERKLEGVLARQAEQVEAAFLNGGLAPPAPAEVAAQLKLAPQTFREILKYLRDTGRTVEAAPDVIFHCGHVERAKSELRALFAALPERTTSEIRQHLGMNRKFVIPLVELLDRQKFSVRLGDKRRLM